MFQQFRQLVIDGVENPSIPGRETLFATSSG